MAGRAATAHLHERAAAQVGCSAERHQGSPVRAPPPRKLRCPVGAVHGQAQAGEEEDGSDAHVVLQVQGCEAHVPRGLQQKQKKEGAGKGAGARCLMRCQACPCAGKHQAATAESAAGCRLLCLPACLPACLGAPAPPPPPPPHPPTHPPTHPLTCSSV